MSCKRSTAAVAMHLTVGGLAVAAGLQAPVMLAQAATNGSPGGSSPSQKATLLIHGAGVSVAFAGANPQTKQTTFTGSETNIAATVTTSGASASSQLNLPPVHNGLVTVTGYDSITSSVQVSFPLPTTSGNAITNATTSSGGSATTSATTSSYFIFSADAPLDFAIQDPPPLSSEMTDSSAVSSQLSLVDTDTNEVLYLDADQEDVGSLTGTLASGDTYELFSSLYVSGDVADTVSYGSSIALSPIPDTTAVTPEPSSFLLLGTGLLGAAGVIKRRLE